MHTVFDLNDRYQIIGQWGRFTGQPLDGVAERERQRGVPLLRLGLVGRSGKGLAGVELAREPVGEPFALLPTAAADRNADHARTRGETSQQRQFDFDRMLLLMCGRVELQVDEAVVLQYRFGPAVGGPIGDGDESHAIGQEDRSPVQVVEQRLVFAQDNQLGTRTERDFQKRGAFQIHIEKFRDTADDRVPRCVLGRSGAGEDILHADPQTLLPEFEVFEQTLSRLRRAAAFAFLGEIPLGLLLFAQQIRAVRLCCSQVLQRRRLILRGVVDPLQTAGAFEFPFRDRSIQGVDLGDDLLPRRL